jgi:hypothetical protein
MDFQWKDPLLFCSLPLFLLVFSRRKLLGALGSLLPVYCLALTCCMYLYFNFLYRLELPYTLAAGFSGVLAAAWLGQRVQASTRAYVCAGLLGGLLALQAAYTLAAPVVENHAAVALRVQRQEEKTKELNRDFKGAVILGQVNVGISPQYGDPLEVESYDYRPIVLGWNSFSPDFYRETAPLGISHGYELVAALVDRPDAYVLGTEDWCKSMLAIDQGTRGRSIAVVPVRRFQDGTTLFKLVSGKK